MRDYIRARRIYMKAGSRNSRGGTVTLQVLTDDYQSLEIELLHATEDDNLRITKYIYHDIIGEIKPYNSDMMYTQRGSPKSYNERLDQLQQRVEELEQQLAAAKEPTQ